MKAYTLFNLKPDVTAAEYRRWSLEQVRPRMLQMPSVLTFLDYQIAGTMNDEQPPYEFVEEIEITSPEEFERDNSQGDGAELAKEWQDRVSDFVVIYCNDIEELENR